MQRAPLNRALLLSQAAATAPRRPVGRCMPQGVHHGMPGNVAITISRMKPAAAIATQPSMVRAARDAPARGGCWSRMQDSLSSELLADSRNFYFNSCDML